jgi:hypothetical protein
LDVRRKAAVSEPRMFLGIGFGAMHVKLRLSRRFAGKCVDLVRTSNGGLRKPWFLGGFRAPPLKSAVFFY